MSIWVKALFAVVFFASAGISVLLFLLINDNHNWNRDGAIYSFLGKGLEISFPQHFANGNYRESGIEPGCLFRKVDVTTRQSGSVRAASYGPWQFDGRPHCSDHIFLKAQEYEPKAKEVGWLACSPGVVQFERGSFLDSEFPVVGTISALKGFNPGVFPDSQSYEAFSELNVWTDKNRLAIEADYLRKLTASHVSIDLAEDCGAFDIYEFRIDQP